MRISRSACCMAKASSINRTTSKRWKPARAGPNVVNVRLRPNLLMDVQTAERRFSAGSSCGVCGTTGLDAAIARAAAIQIADTTSLEMSVLLGLPSVMRAAQAKFGDTGGIHAAGLFDLAGRLISVAEDVGRHNALDKLVGESLMQGRLPLTGRIILLSGRASFELVQKALRSGVSILAAIGAPLEPRRQSRARLRFDPGRLRTPEPFQYLRESAADQRTSPVKHRKRPLLARQSRVMPSRSARSTPKAVVPLREIITECSCVPPSAPSRRSAGRW